MQRKLFHRLVVSIFIIYTFNQCRDVYLNIPANATPVYKKGDTLIYANEIGKKDTFQVTKFDFGYYFDSKSTYFQTLDFEINMINSIPDTSCFDQMFSHDSEEYCCLYLSVRKNDKITSFSFGESYSDTVAQPFTINNKKYNEVCYYSYENSNIGYKNLYINPKYLILSIEINNQHFFLSETKPEH
jgi:hypothetical protein